MDRFEILNAMLICRIQREGWVMLTNKRNIFIVGMILTSSKSRGKNVKTKADEISFLIIIQMILLFSEE